MSKPERDTTFVKSHIKEVEKQVIADHDTYIDLPQIFEEGKLLTVGKVISCIGVFPIIIQDKYLVIRSPLMYTFRPDSIVEEEVDGEVYYRLGFEAGKPLFNLTMAKNAIKLTELFSFVGLRGKIPYYCTRDTALRLVDNASTYAGINLNQESAIIELLLSMCQRATDDSTLLSRYAPDRPVQYVPLTDVNVGTFSNFSRLLNGYQASGMITSLVNDTDTQPSPLERTLRR